jgi:3-deoxy-D-manno-octulosonic-acid transferase
MRSVLWGLYQVVWGGLLVVAGPILLALRGAHYLQSVRRRLGKGTPPASAPGALWLHAVSVGEVEVAATLARSLPVELPLLVTTVTPTGQARACALFAGRATVDYLPFDLGFAVRRFFRRHAPGALVLVEGDYWPLVLRAANRAGVPVAVVNGRVGDRSFRRMSSLRPFLGPLFDGIDRFGLQTAADAERLAALGIGAERLFVTGNLKFETREPPELPELGRELLALAADRPLLVAGSTMEGEEEAVLRAFAAAGGGERALLVLAPRHPERWEAVASLLKARGLPCVRRTEVSIPGQPAAGPVAVVLLDTLGELASVYRLARGAFVGGSLVPKGGHNPLEPARVGVPVAVGPSMENFREIAQEFDRIQAWGRVADAEEMGALWRRWLDRPEEARDLGAKARRLVLENRGAGERTLALLAPLLAGLGEPAAGARPGGEA